MKKTAADAVERVFRRHGVVLTLGAEPTCVPRHPDGAEWHFAATGPTKLDYARRLAAALTATALPGAVTVFAPGKLYPGEVNPRWALHVLARADGRPFGGASGRGRRAATAADVRKFFAALGRRLGCAARAQKLPAARPGGSAAWVLPLDRTRRGWRSPVWRWDRGARLLAAEGPAGLRLPWDRARGRGARRALTVQADGRALEIFLPPLRQADWTELLEAVEAARPAGLGVVFSGYVPEDEAGVWRGVVLSADPGVLEINLPPCRHWHEYRRWLRVLDRAQKAAGLRTWKRGRDGRPGGTGGGHHLLFGGESPGTNPFFTRPGWVASLLRFWQHHPSLAYLFTGCYVGASSQAPRPDESGKTIADLEMACAWLEALPAGRDHRRAITETLIHLQSDASGNTHRSEMSFDKFWNTQFPGGTRGLIEFRAVESLPRPDWAAAVALLWCALAAHVLDRPCRAALADFGSALHDRWFLPSFLWSDFRRVLAELAGAGLTLDEQPFRAIWDWRFPVLLRSGGLTVRRALEAWPLLCETPLEGGATSRFVDTSMERLEFAVEAGSARAPSLRVNGRPLPWRETPDGRRVAGLRYRSSALYPSLHPGFPVQMPLTVEYGTGSAARSFVLAADRPVFRPARRSAPRPPSGEPLRAPAPGGWTFDLRL
jgi:uncharacterized protein (DUF2126 family)